MGTYCYRVLAKSKKMKSGETVRLMKFHHKPSYSFNRIGVVECPGEKQIEACLVAYDFSPASEVRTMSEGSNYWYDTNENRTEYYGSIIPDGNRWVILKGLGHWERKALESIYISIGSVTTWGMFERITGKIDCNSLRLKITITEDVTGKLLYGKLISSGHKSTIEDRIALYGSEMDKAQKIFRKEAESRAA